ncbi:uncharacterized protein LOC113290891 [Papaver somniferum]|uniref:uncharacterized protein LOC113290891 n=1 Tax=Papaver somniferum TaxID=3469 RepID=UPI000E6FAEB9|nr:uncharacterized protein LOC113290891 [Papaver somniferum]
MSLFVPFFDKLFPACHIQDTSFLLPAPHSSASILPILVLVLIGQSNTSHLLSVETQTKVVNSSSSKSEEILIKIKISSVETQTKVVNSSSSKSEELLIKIKIRMSTETAKWCNSLEKSLCELLIVQILGGKKPKSFVKEAWIEVKYEFNKKNGQNFTMDQIKNRYNLFRVRHNDMKKLMSLSGFEWDSEDKKIIVDDEGVWDAYLGEYPDKKKYKTNGCPIYEELCTIFGGSTVTGSNAYASAQSIDDDTPAKSSRKGSSVVGVEERATSTAGMSEALFAIADATKAKHVIDLDKDPFSIPNCTKYFQSLDGVSVRSLMGALEKFQDAVWRQVFMSLDPNNQKEWLKSLGS